MSNESGARVVSAGAAWAVSSDRAPRVYPHSCRTAAERGRQGRVQLAGSLGQREAGVAGPFRQLERIHREGVGD